MLRNLFISSIFLSAASVLGAACIVGLVIHEARKGDKRREQDIPDELRSRLAHPSHQAKAPSVPTSPEVQQHQRAADIAKAVSQAHMFSETGRIDFGGEAR